ncbi:MAG: hypothetical protein DRQ63_09745 [Gammaproteobacteria bacterium]|nr:MAG: hypothetical protein DRQ63_09745 [Gammaproteobacteria bacterium]
MMKKRDHSLELLLDLDGLDFAQGGGYWIKYEVSAVEKTTERPHGIKYSLTLHDPQGERIFGIDNAHRPKKRLGPAARSTRPKAADHMHRGGRECTYEFESAETLLVDFDKGVNAALKMRGIKI